MSVSAVLSGLALIEVQLFGWRGLPMLAMDTPSKFRTLGWHLDANGKTAFGVEDFSKRDGLPVRTKGDLQNLMARFKAVGAVIYATVDTYMTMVYQWRICRPEDIHRVFPWPADQHAAHVPVVTDEVDRTCRAVAEYYWNLSQKQVECWDGPRRFVHRACNTLSYRAYAAYQVVERAMRYQIRPAVEGRQVLQFDWSAAEWSLILQANGYESPDDAYANFTAIGLDRDLTKVIVLAWIYGAMLQTLEAKVTETGQDPALVGVITGRIQEVYPRVIGWRETCLANDSASFHGWNIALGDKPHQRPNHYAQTALQVCKWDLITRLHKLGAAPLACGDLHDQLFFDFDPVTERAMAGAIIEEIRKPTIGGIKLKPNFKVGPTWNAS